MRRQLRLCVLGLALGTFFPLTGAWALQATPTSLTFIGPQGGANPASQAVSVFKNNKRSLNWTSSDNASWLNATPTSGSLTQAAQIIVTVNTMGLSAGVYTGTVIITVNKGGSLALPVTLLITPLAPTTSPTPTTSTTTTPSTSTAPTTTTTPSTSTTPTTPTTPTTSTTPTPSTSSTGTTATLTWSANTETDLAGYNFYMGNASGTYGPAVSLGKVTSYVVRNLQVGNTYYFAISAYDTSGNESLPSTEVSKSIY